MNEINYNIQVDAEKHYLNDRYDNLERFISYYHQIDWVRRLQVKSVLEVGIGNGLVANYLRNLDIKVTTCDFDANVKPDIVADVREIPIDNNSFELAMACQILEHIPFEDFPLALAELSRISSKYVIISLPVRSSYFEFILKFPFIRTMFKRNFFDFTFHKFIKFPGFESSGQHYWEIDQKDFTFKKIKLLVNEKFNIIAEFSPVLNKYHYFLILEKK